MNVFVIKDLNAGIFYTRKFVPEFKGEFRDWAPAAYAHHWRTRSAASAWANRLFGKGKQPSSWHLAERIRHPNVAIVACPLDMLGGEAFPLKWS